MKYFIFMTKIHEIRDRILLDLANQSLTHYPSLPQSKILANRYQISQPTLRIILRELKMQGHLEQIGAKYRLPGNSHPDIPSSYIQVVMGANEQGLRLETPREIDFFRNLLHVSRSRQLGLRVVGVEDWLEGPKWMKEDGAEDSSLNPVQAPPGLVGTILSPWHMRDARNILARLFQAPTNAPIAVWMEESGIEKWSVGKQSARGKRKLCFFDVAYGKNPGFIVAKFLQSKGISNAAFFSPFHKSDWSKDRLEAIRTTLKKSGGQVTPFTIGNALSPWDFRHEVEKIPSLLALKKKLLQPVLNTPMSPRIVQNLENNLVETFRDHRIAGVLHPYFQKALGGKFAAWVCVNDLVALLAQDFLKSQGIPKKDYPLLVGFDNIPETFVHGISSLECSTLDLVQSMVDYLQHPGHAAFTGRSIVRIPGKMYSR